MSIIMLKLKLGQRLRSRWWRKGLLIARSGPPRSLELSVRTDSRR